MRVYEVISNALSSNVGNGSYLEVFYYFPLFINVCLFKSVICL